MEAFLKEKPHRRYNILTGEWILVSPHRTKRPWQGKKEKSVTDTMVSYDPNCYLCPGNNRLGGDVNEKYKDTFSFTNDFGALHQDNSDGVYDNALLKGKEESGICKVICFSPDHSKTLPLMSADEIEKIIQLWQKEYRELGSIDDINHVQIFENKGVIMGCSNPHPHGQIWAQASIPEVVLTKQKKQYTYFTENGNSLLGDYLEQELALETRIILENEDFVALVPFWATWPFESMILPKKHRSNITALTQVENKNLAEILRLLTIKYDNLFLTSFPYSSGIHQAPTDGKDHPEWHFHMSFYPPLLRSAEVKKFMVGYEMFANAQRDITPESAAQQLRNLPIIHYMNTP